MWDFMFFVYSFAFVIVSALILKMFDFTGVEYAMITILVMLLSMIFGSVMATITHGKYHH